VFGVLATGFVLLGLIGETATLCVAASFNVCSAVFALAWASHRMETVSPTADSSTQANSEPFPPMIRRLGLLAFFVSGLTALAYEVLWTRLLTPFLYTSIYAFSTMLAAFLVGVARGSRESITNRWTNQSPVAAFGMLEVLIAFGALVGIASLPFFNQLGNSLGNLGGIAGVFACGLVVLPVAFCFGLQFPAAVRVCAGNPKDAAGTTGWAYAVNTFGAIVGSLSAGFLLIPWLGTAGAVVFLAGANLILGLALLGASQEGRRQLRPAGLIAVAFVAMLPFLGDPYRKVMASRITAFYGPEATIFEYAERTCATTIAAGNPNPFERTLLVNGVGMTLLCSETKIMAHLPMLLAEKPKNMLIICFGMGTTFRSACRHEGLEVDVVDIVPDVFRCFEHFHQDAAEFRNRPNAKFIVNDGRNHLLMTNKKYDVITIDPAPPVHSAGTVNLYTKEFFELCRSRLSPGGIFCLWLPPDAVRSEICMVMKSYLEVFPHATAWGGLRFPGFYMIAGHRPLPVSPSHRRELLAQLARIPDMGEWDKDYANPDKLAETFLMDADGLGNFLKNYPSVTDDMPYTEFPLWRWAFNEHAPKPFDANDIRNEMSSLAQKSAATTSLAQKD
jgi:spermidine synthase